MHAVRGSCTLYINYYRFTGAVKHEVWVLKSGSKVHTGKNILGLL